MAWRGAIAVTKGLSLQKKTTKAKQERDKQIKKWRDAYQRQSTLFEEQRNDSVLFRESMDDGRHETEPNGHNYLSSQPNAKQGAQDGHLNTDNGAMKPRYYNK